MRQADQHYVHAAGRKLGLSTGCYRNASDPAHARDAIDQLVGMQLGKASCVGFGCDYSNIFAAGVAQDHVRCAIGRPRRDSNHIRVARDKLGRKCRGRKRT